MKLLLIVGSANDIFIYNYAKWLKKSMDVTIDVFEFYPSTQQGYGNEYYDSLTTAKSCGIPGVRGYVDPFVKGRNLTSYLKDKRYDIIHCHWVIAPLVLSEGLKSHCNKLVVTFWGREYANIKIMGFNFWFRRRLNSFVKDVDAIINSKTFEQRFKEEAPMYKGDFYYASFGSKPLEELYQLMEIEERVDSKRTWNIPVDKYCVMIGYSAKKVHQHLAIIEELSKNDNLKQRIHLLAPMTRGGRKDYVDKVKKALQNSGYTYTFIEGRFLSDTEVAQLRNATDITLQLAESDGFSRSIIECLCAKSVMIYGEWLNYDNYLQSDGFEAIKVNNIEEGITKIQSVIDNMSSYEDMVSSNHRSGKQVHLWSECIKDWVNAYNALIN